MESFPRLARGLPIIAHEPAIRSRPRRRHRQAASRGHRDTGEPLTAVDDAWRRSSPGDARGPRMAGYRVTCAGAARLEVARVASNASQRRLSDRLREPARAIADQAFDGDRRVSTHAPCRGGQSRSWRRRTVAGVPPAIARRPGDGARPRAFPTLAQTARTVRTNPAAAVAAGGQYLHAAAARRRADRRDAPSSGGPHRIRDDESQHVSLFDLTEIDADVVLQSCRAMRVGPEGIAAAAAVAPAGVWFPTAREGSIGQNRFVRPWRPPWPMPARGAARAWASDVDTLRPPPRREGRWSPAAAAVAVPAGADVRKSGR